MLRNTMVFPALAAAFLWPFGAFAEDGGSYPALEGTLDLKSYNDAYFNSDDPGSELNGLSLDAELGLKLSLTPIFSINSDIMLKPIADVGPGTFRGYDALGLYAETLYLQADVGANGIKAGKIDPSFGHAWSDTPGVFGSKLAETYQLTEMWGVGGWHRFETAGAGTYTLAANIFYADTTFLSESLFAHRGPNTIAAGGPANTGRPDSFSITLDGADIPALEGFSYNLGFRHLAAGSGDAADENGFVAGFEQEAGVFDDAKLNVIGEFVYLSHAWSSPDDATYSTAGLKLSKGPWHGELSGTLQNTQFAAGGSQNDYIAQVSVGYVFQNGLDVSLGYGSGRNGDATTNLIGLQLHKSLDFKLGG
jgi:hypothetical protein